MLLKGTRSQSFTASVLVGCSNMSSNCKSDRWAEITIGRSCFQTASFKVECIKLTLWLSNMSSVSVKWSVRRAHDKRQTWHWSAHGPGASAAPDMKLHSPNRAVIVSWPFQILGPAASPQDTVACALTRTRPRRLKQHSSHIYFLPAKCCAWWAALTNTGMGMWRSQESHKQRGKYGKRDVWESYWSCSFVFFFINTWIFPAAAARTSFTLIQALDTGEIWCALLLSQLISIWTNCMANFSKATA